MGVWAPIDFRNFDVKPLGNSWAPPPPLPASVGTVLRAAQCTPNGVSDDVQAFDIRSDWALFHRATGLCAEAESANYGAGITLQECVADTQTQEFRNDYTNVRNERVPFTLGKYGE